MEYPSKIIGDTIEAFAKLPGIGKKTATRLVLHLLKQNEKDNDKFGELLTQLVRKVSYCKVCHNLSDDEICYICRDKKRDQDMICVVEDIRDVLAIENTNQYNGSYHVLGGLISPMDGVSPSDLNIEALVKRANSNGVQELIFALSSTMEGDTTAYYICKMVRDKKIRTSTISRGISVGGELEFADEITLGRSISGRVPYKV